MPLRARVSGVAALLLGAPVALPAGAQARPAPGVIDGVVTDVNLISLGDATASILGSNVKVVTGASGRFRMLSVPAGQYILVVQHIGFAPSSMTLQVAAGDTLRMSFALERIRSVLDTVTISGKRLGMRLAEFESRRVAGFGQFMTREQIEKRNVVYAGDLLRTFTSVALTFTKRGDRIATGIRGGCQMQVYLDGIALGQPVDVDHLPSPRELAGIEVYSGPAQIPLQYKTSNGGFCGVILVWTKDGS